MGKVSPTDESIKGETVEEKIKTIEVSTQPLSSIDKKLDEKFAESIAEQSKLMDEIAKQLLTIELALPAIYATVLKLVTGSESLTESSIWLVLTFLCWFVALVLTFFSLVPIRYKIDTERLDSIEAFFIKSAKYKRKMLIGSAFIFFLGVLTSIFTVS